MNNYSSSGPRRFPLIMHAARCTVRYLHIISTYREFDLFGGFAFYACCVTPCSDGNYHRRLSNSDNILLITRADGRVPPRPSWQKRFRPTSVRILYSWRRATRVNIQYSVFHSTNAINIILFVILTIFFSFPINIILFPYDIVF